MKIAHRILYPSNRDPRFHHLCALAVITKAPRAGQVKTRLVPPLTPDEAAQLNRCFLRDTASAISSGAGQIARGIAVYTPVGAEADYIDILPRDFELLAQRGDGFDERLFNAASPTVPAENYAQAARLLAPAGDRVVLGPSDDGGYYLIGLKQNHRRLFEEIEWSTERVLEQTIERANELKLALELLPTGYDVDDRTSLRRLCDELFNHNKKSTTQVAPHTSEYLGSLQVQREL